MSEVIETVPSDDWVARATALRADGYTFCDVLSAQDETGADGDVRTRVLLRVRRDGTWEPASIAVDVADTLPSLQGVYPGIAWYEREAAEMFGLTLVAPDGATVDTRPLLLHAGEPNRMVTAATTNDDAAPLRKGVWLAARRETPWPGAADPGTGRRRQRPIGVSDDRAADRAVDRSPDREARR